MREFLKNWAKNRYRNRAQFFIFSLSFNVLAIALVYQTGWVDHYIQGFFDGTAPNSRIQRPESHGLRLDSFEIANDGWPALFSYKPDGISPRRVDQECWVEELNEQIRKHPFAIYQQAAAISDYFMRCQDHLYYGRERGIDPLVDYMNLYYPIADMDREIRSVTFRLKDDRVITGLLAVQDTQKPRPLVIVKCGMFCNAAESSNPANAFMHLYDESPFHVLVLSNIASQDFEIMNGGIAIGGFDEGAQIYELAKWLRSKKSPFEKRISSVHVVGFSLGSHGVLYSSLYSSLNDSEDNPVINSAVAICPVVQLETSISSLFHGAISGRVAGVMASREMMGVMEKVETVKTEVLKQWIPDPVEILNEVEKAIENYYTDLTAKGWKLNPFRGDKLADIEEFWRRNDFTSYAHLVTRPTLLLPAENDGIVNTAENAALLTRLPDTKKSKVQVVSLKDGNHCAHSIANGWKLTSGILRNFILSHSPELKVEEQQISVIKEMEWDRWPFSADLHAYEQYYGAKWKFKEGEDSAKVVFEILQKTVAECNYGVNRPESCFRQIEARLPIKSIEPLGFKVPESDVEAYQLTRKANTRLRLLNINRQDVRVSNQRPAFVSMHMIEN